MPENSPIHLRDNPHVTRQENQAHKFSRTSFYSTTIYLQDTSCVVDQSGDVLVILLKGIVPEHLLQQAEATTAKHMTLALKHASKDDIRGKRIAANFGSYVEQGGSGKTWVKKGYDWCPDFLNDIHEVGVFVDAVYSSFCVEIAACLEFVPEPFKLWKSISQLFWNVSSISKRHLDFKDLKYSIVLPFGQFKESLVDLTYLNTCVNAQRGDLYILNSQKVYHTVIKPDPTRQSFVFTNHNCVVQRFVDVDISNLFEDLNKL